MDKNLKVKALIGVLLTPFIFALPVFLPAGTLNYWKGWVFVAVLTTATTLHTLYLMKFDPALLERRMRAGPTAEKRSAQQIIMVFVLASFFLLMIVSGIDHRFGWSHLPDLVVLIGDAMIVLSFLVFHIVFRENSFASATIELSEGQKVVSTGPYSIVRHPMYAGGFLMFFGIPLALGSLWALLVLVAMLPALIWRIMDEEKFLSTSLEGYAEYCHKVKYRLIPGVY